MVEIHPKKEISNFSNPIPNPIKNEEEEISDIDMSRYMLLMKYTKEGERRIINNQGRCVISNHTSELFLNTGREKSIFYNGYN